MKKLLNNLLGAGLLLSSLAGCAYFSHPVMHEVNPPSIWNNAESTNALMSAEGLAHLQWWQQFHDATLNQLVESALQQNSDVLIAMANLNNSQAQLKQVQLSWIPTLPLLLGYSDMPTLGSPGYFVGVFPSYTINIFGQIKAQEQANAQVKISQENLNGVRLSVIGQTVNAYFTWLSQERQLQLSEDLLKIYQERVNSYRQQFSLGLADAKAVSNADSDVMQTMGQIETIKNNLLVSQNSLRYLINQNPGSVATKNNFAQLNVESIVPGSLPMTVLANRPDVKAAMDQLSASDAGIGKIISNLLPTIQLDTLLAKNAMAANQISNPSNLSMGDAYATIPLVNAQVFGQIQASKALYSTDYYVYEQTVRKALRDVENDLVANKLYSSRYQHFSQANLSLEQGCANDLAQFQNGLSNLTTVLECQIGVTQAQIALTQTKLDTLLVRVALYQDLGGGYAVMGKF